MSDLPKKVELEDGTIVPIDDYCALHCPSRYDSECWIGCWLKEEWKAEQGYDDYEDDYGDDFDDFFDDWED